MVTDEFLILEPDGNIAVIAADADAARALIAEEYGMDIAAVEVERRSMRMDIIIDGEQWWKFCDDDHSDAVSWWVEVV